MRRYQVAYLVVGKQEEFFAGPYTKVEAEDHYNDIAGYMGVHGTRIIEMDEEVKVPKNKRIIEL